jgi:hypothetical protein
MLNIILKNKQLIKLYKYSVWLFKFLNKHFYIMSIISLIARFRKGIYYKAITLTIKIIIAINLLITSGLFFTLADFATPLLAIQQFYKDFVGPYLEMINNQLTTIYNKYDGIAQLKDKAESNYGKNVFKSITENNLIETASDNSNIDATLSNHADVKDSNKFSVGTVICLVAVASLVYIVFFLPGGGPTPPTPDILADYSTINRTLIDGKVLLKQYWDMLYGTTSPTVKPGVAPTNSPEGIIRSLSGGSEISSVGSNTPTPVTGQLSEASTSSLTSGFNKLTEIKSTIDPNISPVKETVDAVVETEFHLPTIDHIINSAMRRFFGSTDIGTQTNIISTREDPITYEVSDADLDYTNNKIIEPSINKNTPWPQATAFFSLNPFILLKSTQLLQSNEKE